MADWTKRFGLAGKRATVTGATKGIGFETRLHIRLNRG